MKIKYYFAKAIKYLHIPAVIKSNIHHSSKIASGSHIVDSNLDRYSFIGSNCTIVNTNIKSFCSIADNVVIGGAAHPIYWTSTSPIFHNGKNILKKNFSYHKFQTTKRTHIKNDVWIGSNCLIKSGVIIDNGAIIGMGSVVTKDVGAYEIWAGNPAKKIKKRFNDDTIEKLLTIKWWEWDNNKLENNAQLMNNVSKFIKKCDN